MDSPNYWGKAEMELFYDLAFVRKWNLLDEWQGWLRKVYLDASYIQSQNNPTTAQCLGKNDTVKYGSLLLLEQWDQRAEVTDRPLASHITQSSPRALRTC